MFRALLFAVRVLLLVVYCSLSYRTVPCLFFFSGSHLYWKTFSRLEHVLRLFTTDSNAVTQLHCIRPARSAYGLASSFLR
jgi:hypothetical protein